MLFQHSIEVLQIVQLILLSFKILRKLLYLLRWYIRTVLLFETRLKIRLTSTEAWVAEKATTPAQSAAVPIFNEPTVVIPEVGGSGMAASVRMETARNITNHTTLQQNFL